MSDFMLQEKLEAMVYISKLDLDQDTVIDDTWYAYLWDEIETLEALKIVSGLRNYREIYNTFEGYTLEEFLDYHIK